MLDSRVLIEGAYSADDRPRVRALVRRLIRLPPLIVVLLLSIGLWAAIWGSSRLLLRLCRDSQFTRSAVPIARLLHQRQKGSAALVPLFNPKRTVHSLAPHPRHPTRIGVADREASQVDSDKLVAITRQSPLATRWLSSLSRKSFENIKVWQRITALPV